MIFINATLIVIVLIYH